jgi:hypothetical protein
MEEIRRFLIHDFFNIMPIFPNFANMLLEKHQKALYRKETDMMSVKKSNFSQKLHLKKFFLKKLQVP